VTGHRCCSQARDNRRIGSATPSGIRVSAGITLHVKRRRLLRRLLTVVISRSKGRDIELQYGESGDHGTVTLSGWPDNSVGVAEQS
jgi:hypothetical protein